MNKLKPLMRQKRVAAIFFTTLLVAVAFILHGNKASSKTGTPTLAPSLVATQTSLTDNSPGGNANRNYLINSDERPFYVAVSNFAGPVAAVKKQTPKSKLERMFYLTSQLLPPNNLNVFAVPTVTASKTDALVATPNNGDGKADPGDTIGYTVTINASGMDALGMMFNDTPDDNTMLVAGSVMTTPIARNDQYAATGNIRIQILAASGVLVNDNDPDGVGPALTATAGTFLSTNGGNVTLNADGSFSYNPPAGFEGMDTFTYTLNDGEGNTDTGSVTINVSQMIWFINNNAGSAGDGRLTNPFNTLAAFEAVNGNGGANDPAAGEPIFIYESATAYSGPVTLENNQRLIGQDATGASVAALAGITPAPNSDALPELNSGNATIVTITSAGIAINVASGNTLRGFTGGNAGTDISGTGFGTLNIADVTLNGTGQALNLTNGTLAANIASISSTNSTTTGISLNNVAGSLMTGSTSITNPTNAGINISNSSAAFNFGSTTANQSGGTGVSLTSNTGTFTFGSLNISPDAGQRGFHATNNTMAITTTSGAISTSNAIAVEITRTSPNNTPLNMQLTSVSANGGTSGIILTNISSTGSPGGFRINGSGTTDASGGTIQNTTGDGIALTNTSFTILKNMVIGDSTAAPNQAPDAVNNIGGDGIAMNNADNATLDNVKIARTGAHGIDGTGVTNLTISNSEFLNNGDGNDEHAMAFNDLSQNNLDGTVTISDTIFDGYHEDGIQVENFSGTLNLTVSGSRFANNDATFGENGILARADGTSNITLTVNDSASNQAVFDVIDGNSIAVFSDAAGSTANVTVNGVTVNGSLNPADGNAIAIVLFGGEGTFNFNILNNSITNAGATGISIQPNGDSNMQGTVSGNTVNGTGSGRGIEVLSDDTSDGVVNISSNNVSNAFCNAIFASNQNTGDLDITIRNNTGGMVASPCGGLASHVIEVNVRETSTNCLDIANNNAIPTGAGNVSFRTRQRDTSLFRLERFVGTGTSTTDVESFLRAQNGNDVGETASATVSTTYTGVADGTCQNPPPPSSFTDTSSFKDLTSKQQVPAVEDILWAVNSRSQEKSDIPNLTQNQLQAFVQAALERWRGAGISEEDFNRLQSVAFEIADLPEGQLSTATSGLVRISPTAAGFGWYLDPIPSDDAEFALPLIGFERQSTESSPAFGRVDLLTVITRALGNALDKEKLQLESQQGWLMQNSLGTGVRRAPVLDWTQPDDPTSDIQYIDSPAPSTLSVQSGAAPLADNPLKTESQTGNFNNLGGTPVSLNIGDLPAGKSVTITFNVMVNSPSLPLGTTQISNQGTVSGSNFSNVLTDDPDIGGATDPTTTPVDRPDTSVASITRSGSDPTNAGSVSWTVTFADAAINLSGGNFTLVNTGLGGTPAITGVAPVGMTPATQWTVTASTGNGDGTLGLNMTNDTGFSHDVTNLGFTGEVYTIDRTPPTVTMSSTATDPTNSSPIPVTAQFSENVTGFTVGDIAAGNATVGNFVAVDGDTYTFDLTPAGQGTVTADIAANTATDAAGNGNTAATQFSRTFDTVPPNVSLNSATMDPTNASPIPVTAQFSENVTGFTAADIIAGNATVGNFAAIDGDTYTFDLTPISQGLVTADVAANIATDAAGNGNTAATQFSRTFDSIAPMVEMSSADPDPTNTSPIPVTVQFSESVTGFTAGDVVPGNATVDNFMAVGGDTYTFDLTPSGQGLVAADIAAGVAQDAAGNGNSAAAQFSRTFDSVGPTVAMSSVTSNPTNNSPIPVTVQFNETVTGFTDSDIVPGNATVGNFMAVDGDTYTFDLTPAGQGAVTADIAADVAFDAAGNGNSTAAQFSRTFDSIAPTVTINQESGQADPTNASPINFTVVFNEPITGFGDSASDVTLSGTAGATTAVVTEIVPNDGTTYNVAVSGMSSSGTVMASVTANAATDAAGNGNVASTSSDNTVTYDIFKPDVTINQAAGQPDPAMGSGATIHFTAVFTEPITGFINSDVTLSGTAGATTAVVMEIAPNDGTTYDVAVSGMTMEGTVTASIPANAAQDAAGNLSNASTSTDNTVTFIPNTPPTANPDSYQTDEDTLLSVMAPGVLGNDTDPDMGDTLTAVLVSGPSNAQSFTLNANGSFSYTPTADFFGGDSFSYKARDSHNAESGTVTVSITVNPVNDPPVVMNNLASQNVQYSDSISNVTVTATDVDSTSLSASASYSTNGGGSFMSGLPTGLSLSSPTCTPSGAGTSCQWTLSGTAQVAAGTYIVRVSVGDGAAPTPGTGFTDTTIVVKKEHVETVYTGDEYALTAGPNISTAIITLAANLTQAADGNPGDITLARVTFELFKAGNLSSTPDITVSNVPVDSSGNAQTTYNLAVDIWTIKVRIDSTNGYWKASPVGMGMLTIEAPSTELRTSGGGWIPDPESTNGKGNFGFNVAAQKKNGIKGTSQYLFRGIDGYNYLVKSTSWQGGGLTFFKDGQLISKASFSGKCVVQKIDTETGEVVESFGNYSFTVDVLDGDLYKPKQSDRYAITILDNSGSLWRQIGTRTNPIVIGGGNITVQGGKK